VPTFVDRGVSRGQRGGSLKFVKLSFLDQSRYFFGSINGGELLACVSDHQLVEKNCGISRCCIFCRLETNYGDEGINSAFRVMNSC
jgi:hypothetical protein